MLRTTMSCLAAALLVVGCSQADDTVALTTGSSAYRSAIYSCDDGTDFVADFAGSRVTLSIASGPTVVLTQKRAASGIWYGNNAYDLRGKGTNAVFRAPGRQAANCMSLE